MKKILAFVYGIVAYVLFLISFLYAIGFVGNIGVPKSMDSGAQAHFFQSLFLNIGLLGVFAIQHSIMARPAFKKWTTYFLNPAIERSTYVLASSLALLLLYWQWQPMPAVVWEVDNEVIAGLVTVIFYCGWLIVLLSTFMINHFELFGLTQIFLNLKNRSASTPGFKTSYLYKIVRHPIMLGFIIAFWATPSMSMGHLLFSTVTTLYILIAVKYMEEKDLRKSIGEAYENYQKEVPMIIPLSKIKK